MRSLGSCQTESDRFAVWQGPLGDGKRCRVCDTGRGQLASLSLCESMACLAAVVHEIAATFTTTFAVQKRATFH